MAAGAPKNLTLTKRMEALGIREADLEESFVRSGGKGGQNVNKVATCVVLVHVPSGTAVKCQLARTQAANRIAARESLVEKIERARLAERAAKIAKVAKAKRQKRRRPRAVKEKILAAKRARSATKANRGRVRTHGDD